MASSLLGAAACARRCRARCAAAGVALLVWSHLRLVDPSRRLSVAPTIRSALPALLALCAVARAGVLSRPLWPQDPLVLGVAVGGMLLAASALYRALHEAARVVLAPAGGRLLRALERAHVELGESGDLDGVARVALGAARRASGTRTRIRVCTCSIRCSGLRADAAGVPHADVPPPHAELLRVLRAQPGEMIVRAPLDAQMVRAPALRPLLEALSALDALCVLPLVQQGEVEGALVVPRGARMSQLSLEELEALRRFGRHLSGFVAVLCADARAQRRATEARFAETRAQAELGAAQAELTRVARETRVLRAGVRARSAAGPARQRTARAMRALIATLTRHAGGTPLLLVAERGLPAAELAQLVHARSPRAAQPFVVGECAALRPEQSAAVVARRRADGARRHAAARRRGHAAAAATCRRCRSTLQRALARALASAASTLGDDDRLRVRRARARDAAAAIRSARRGGALDPELLAFFAAPCACRRCASAPKTCRR